MKLHTITKNIHEKDWDKQEVLVFKEKNNALNWLKENGFKLVSGDAIYEREHIDFELMFLPNFTNKEKPQAKLSFFETEDK